VKFIAGLLVLALVTGCVTSGVAVNAAPEPAEEPEPVKLDPKFERAVVDVIGGLFTVSLLVLINFPFLIIAP